MNQHDRTIVERSSVRQVQMPRSGKSVRRMCRLALVVVAALVPLNSARVALLNRIDGFEVQRGALVGWLTLMDVHSAAISSTSSVGHLCVFRRVGRLSLCRDAKIGHRNGFYSVRAAAVGESATIGYGNRFQGADWLGDWIPGMKDGQLSIGARVLITAGHFFDTAGGIAIGSDTTIAGRQSEVWTHGVSMHRTLGVAIGTGCYVGSGVRIAAGVRVPDHCLVGLGSVVVESVAEPHSVVAGNPARTIREDSRHLWQAGP